ncbi:hypothetical protein A2U01_0114814, partial [Trifolium medium]|nr:hypothetical protein [Trifolium medium]
CGGGLERLTVVSFLFGRILDCTRAVWCVFVGVMVAATDLSWSGGGGCEVLCLGGGVEVLM